MRFDVAGEPMLDVGKPLQEPQREVIAARVELRAVLHGVVTEREAATNLGLQHALDVVERVRDAFRVLAGPRPAEASGAAAPSRPPR